MATIDMTPYATIQDALDDNTYDGTNGDTFVFPDGWASTEPASLTVATYGKPLTIGTSNPPIHFVRETTTAEVTVNFGNISLFTNNLFGGGFTCDGINFVNTAVGGALAAFSTSNSVPAVFRRCAVQATAPYGSYAYYGRSRVLFDECYFKNLILCFRDYNWIANNCVFDGTANFTTATYGDIYNCLFINGADPSFAGDTRFNTKFINNTIIGSGSGTGLTLSHGFISNNLIVDFAVGIDDGVTTYQHYLFLKNNAFWGCATKTTVNALSETGTTELVRDPFPTPGIYVPDMDPIPEYVGFDPTKISKSAYAGAWPLAGGSSTSFNRLGVTY